MKLCKKSNYKIKYHGKLLKMKNNEKQLNATEAILHSAKILNLLSKNLIKIFFSRIWV